LFSIVFLRCLYELPGVSDAEALVHLVDELVWFKPARQLLVLHDGLGQGVHGFSQTLPGSQPRSATYGEIELALDVSGSHLQERRRCHQLTRDGIMEVPTRWVQKADLDLPAHELLV
jgi:hypothetical protein